MPRGSNGHFGPLPEPDSHSLIRASRPAPDAKPYIRTVTVSAVPPNQKPADMDSGSLYAFGSFPSAAGDFG